MEEKWRRKIEREKRIKESLLINTKQHAMFYCTHMLKLTKLNWLTTKFGKFMITVKKTPARKDEWKRRYPDNLTIFAVF